MRLLEGTGKANNKFLNFNTLTVQKVKWTLGAAETIGATTVSGGKLTVAGALTTALTLTLGGIGDFTVDFAGATTFKGLGELELTKPYVAKISGFGRGDKIDFLSVKYAVGDKAKVSGATVTIDNDLGQGTRLVQGRRHREGFGFRAGQGRLWTLAGHGARLSDAAGERRCSCSGGPLAFRRRRVSLRRRRRRPTAGTACAISASTLQR